jgi:pyruvate/2-oxoglutarate dehydrogenase complex dihydrolipoamide acyltransferase (E2) component
MAMTAVREIMTAPVVVVQADDSVARIAAVLDQHRISAVPVVGSDGGVIAPEAAILAVGAATPTPVIRDGEVVVVRSILKLTLSVDHRVVDGAPAAAFLRDLKDILEQPLRIMT